MRRTDVITYPLRMSRSVSPVCYVFVVTLVFFLSSYQVVGNIDGSVLVLSGQYVLTVCKKLDLT